jgi:hypothetical protein
VARGADLAAPQRLLLHPREVLLEARRIALFGQRDRARGERVAGVPVGLHALDPVARLAGDACAGAVVAGQHLAVHGAVDEERDIVTSRKNRLFSFPESRRNPSTETR